MVKSNVIMVRKLIEAQYNNYFWLQVLQNFYINFSVTNKK